MITLDFEHIARASETHEQIATFMLDAECTPDEILEALEVYNETGNIESSEVREAMKIADWPIELKMDWDGEHEVEDTEYREHIKLAAD